MKNLTLLIAVLSILFLCISVHAEVRYTVKELGTLGGPASIATAINASGDSVGTALLEDGSNRAVIYNGNTIINCGDLGVPGSFGLGINDSKQATGWSYKPGSNFCRAFIYSDGVMSDLLPDQPASQGNGINNKGQIVGWYGSNENNRRGFLWNDGVMKDIESLGGSTTEAMSINDKTQITGNSRIPTGKVRAFFYENGVMTDCGTLGGSDSFAADISENGVIVGGSYLPGDEVIHAFVWESGQMTDLGTMGGNPCWAMGINDLGGIVGESMTEDNMALHAFVINGNGLEDLNTLIDPSSGWILSSARGINNMGQITGYGLYDGKQLGFVLTPVPEPDPIQEILDFIENSVADGTLVPAKSGPAGKGQLGALINMIKTAGELIKAEDTAGACGQLNAALKKTDGQAPPPDFVTGEAASELASKIQTLMATLGCE